nr:hypothetical protein [Azonexus sp.]
MDIERGTMRSWVVGGDGVKQWADTNEPVEPLYAVHVEGPDDLFAAPSQADAIAVAMHINNALAGMATKPNAKAVPWPHDADAHTENLRQHWSDLVPPNVQYTPHAVYTHFHKGV